MSGHDHPHAHGQRHYWLGCALTLGFAAAEATAGWYANSLALLGDAGHLATDGAALALAGIAAHMAARPASHRHSYGLGRIEVMAALLNTLLMLAIVAGIALEAVWRFRHPPAVDGPLVMAVGAAGIMVNFVIYKVLQQGGSSLNLRASLLHVLGDMLGSAAALTAGLVIWLSGWTPIDPLLSLFIAALILASSLKLLRDAGQVLLEGVPADLDLAAIGRRMAGIEGVRSVHDLHVWNVSSGAVALSAHVLIEDMSHWKPVYQGLKARLHADFGIHHITLQPEPAVLARIPVSQITHR